jgi:hypothetical protein
MTVNVEIPRIEYDGNGTTFTFAFLWSSSSVTEIYVLLNDVLITEGIEYELEDYTQNFGGTIVFNAVPIIGDKIVIYRFTPRTQQLNYADGTAFPSDVPFRTDTHEFQLDKDTRILQELQVEGEGIPGGTVDLTAVPLATQVQITNTGGSDAFIDMWATDGLLAGVSAGAGEIVTPVASRTNAVGTASTETRMSEYDLTSKV